MRHLFVLLLAAALAAADHHVVLVSIDGLAAFYFDDPRAPMPTMRRLAREGARAQGMITSFPSVTWPSHTSLVTGVSPARHGILGNSVIDAKTGAEVTYIGDPVFTKAECVRVPTIYDAVHQAGMRTASVIWPATVGAPTLRWAIPDTNRENVLLRHTTPGLAEELESAGLSIRKLGAWGWNKDYASIRDSLYTRITTHLVGKHQPHLTLLHLISLDGFEHNYGPSVEEAYWAVGFADDRIREIWEALQRPPLAGKSTLIVVSDHGFAEYTKVIRPNVLLKEMGLAASAGGRPRARFHSMGGSGGLYLFEQAGRAGLLASLKDRLAAVEGVDRVMTAAEFTRLGLPEPAANSQQGDLMLSARAGYSFSSESEGELVTTLKERRGTHGHLPQQPILHATFIAAGAAIRPGVSLKVISNLDVAPTIATILDVKLAGVEGRALREILR